MKSSTDPSQKEKPLGEKVQPSPQTSEGWGPYPPNPMLEIHTSGKLRTKPGIEHLLPTPKKP